MEKTTETVISIRLTKPVLRKLSQLAKQETRTRANYIRVVLEEVAQRGGLAISEKKS